MNIALPSSFNRQTMYHFIAQVIDENYAPKYASITFDSHSLRFIRPAGVTVLSNIIQWLLKREVVVNIDYPNHVKDVTGKWNPIMYLDDSGFFEYYAGKKLFPQSQRRSTTMPLRHVAYEEYYAWLEFAFIPWLMRQLEITRQDSVENIKICIQEIFNNIADHSMEQIGCVFAQHYPKNKRIIIVASDFGVGIPSKIREQEKGIDDATALKLAIQEGYSTKTLPTNRGAGLDILISNVVTNTHGKVYIHSNQGILFCTNQRGLTMTSKNCQGRYPGTLFEIMLNTRFFHDRSEEEEFIW